MSPFPVRMENHWSPEPGVDPARARLMWFMLLGGHPQVARLARLGQARLAGIAGLDLVPQEWLHMTTLIAGFADEITQGHVEAMAGQARRLLARTAPVTVTLGRVLYHPRAIMLAARPPQALEPVLRAVQQATHIATGRKGELHHEPWTPHITLAYGNAAQPAGPVIEALGRELPAEQVTISFHQPHIPGTRTVVDLASDHRGTIRDRSAFQFGKRRILILGPGLRLPRCHGLGRAVAFRGENSAKRYGSYPGGYDPDFE